MLALIRKLMKDNKGATAIEYGLIAALVSVAAITALGMMGTSLDKMFRSVSTQLSDSLPATDDGDGGTDPVVE